MMALLDLLLALAALLLLPLMALMARPLTVTCVASATSLSL